MYVSLVILALDVQIPGTFTNLGDWNSGRTNGISNFSLSADGTIGYASYGPFTLTLLNVADPAAMAPLVTVGVGGNYVAANQSTGKIYMTDGRFSVADVRDYANPLVLISHSIEFGEHTGSLLLSADNSLLYVAAGELGLKIASVVGE